MKKNIVGVLLATGLALSPVAALAEGNLAEPPAERLELSITGAGDALALSETTFELETGVYYRLTVTSDGADEVLWAAPDLFLNSWMNQVVINDLEVKLYGTHFQGVEFDGPGTFFFSFVVVRPGEYAFTVGDATGTFVVR